mmetsp:Transcript_14860/g.18835  ORF Transcript_14860/g.18835 Transcript_14860/m.18835 type:complete len:221 (-) Transcript_14860:39-701(-)
MPLIRCWETLRTADVSKPHNFMYVIISFWSIKPVREVHSLNTIPRASLAFSVISYTGLPFTSPVSVIRFTLLAPLIPIIKARASRVFEWSEGDGAPIEVFEAPTPEVDPTLLPMGNTWVVGLVTGLVTASLVSKESEPPGIADCSFKGALSLSNNTIRRAGTCAAMRASRMISPPSSSGMLAISFNKAHNSALYCQVRGANSSKEQTYEMITPNADASQV